MKRANKRPSATKQTHKPGPNKKDKRVKEEKMKRSKRGNGQREGGGMARGGIELEIEIPFLCPASYCLAVWLTKAISCKQQVGMKI